MLIFFTNTILQKKFSKKLKKKKNSQNFHFNFLKTKKRNRTKKSRLNVG